MLTEERYRLILRLLEERGAISVQELTEIVDSSESTIRRDLSALHREGKLNKVHGGATALRGSHRAEEYPAFAGQDHMAEKMRIARYAASLIHDYDLVFMDAGKTTGCMAEFIKAKNITIVTNGLLLAKRLADRDLTVVVTGGHVLPTTEALVGGETMDNLRRYHFSIGFFGANGVSVEAGCTTPDLDEARVKTEALGRCRRRYLLADSSKFDKTLPVSFADLHEVTILTGQKAKDAYHTKASVIEVDA